MLLPLAPFGCGAPDGAPDDEPAADTSAADTHSGDEIRPVDQMADGLPPSASEPPPPPDFGARIVRAQPARDAVPGPAESVRPFLDTAHDWVVAARAVKRIESTTDAPAMGVFEVEETLVGAALEPATEFAVQIHAPAPGCRGPELDVRSNARYVLVLERVDGVDARFRVVDAPRCARGWAVRNDADVVQFQGGAAVSMADLRNALAPKE